MPQYLWKCILKCLKHMRFYDLSYQNKTHKGKYEQLLENFRGYPGDDFDSHFDLLLFLIYYLYYSLSFVGGIFLFKLY